MSVWNPEPGDAWYEEEVQEDIGWTWQGIVMDALILVIVFGFIAFFGFTLGYFNVFKT